MHLPSVPTTKFVSAVVAMEILQFGIFITKLLSVNFKDIPMAHLVLILVVMEINYGLEVLTIQFARGISEKYLVFNFKFSPNILMFVCSRS